ncbi:MAG: aquaporin Z [Proteobacteria bacterium]|nr:aquaporin Z [Pseudomonadota bacterium]
MARKLVAELIGTFWLVFAGCGSAIFAGGSIGVGGVALAFGLTVVTMAAAMGPISGGHFNPAVTLGLVAAGRHPAKDAPPYIAAQLFGAFTAAGLLAFIAHDSGAKDLQQFAANGWGLEGMPKDTAPYAAHLSMAGAFATEFAMTFIFLTVIIASTTKGASVPGLPPLAIGLCLALIHLVSIPLTNTSVNPARSTSQAVYAGGIWISQLWLFWVAPILGGVAAGALSKWLNKPATEAA